MTKSLEVAVERYFVSLARKHRVWALKLNIVGLTGMPDRLCLSYPGRCFFVELKRPRGKLRKRQEICKTKLEYLGFTVYILDDKEKIQTFFNDVYS